MLWQSITIEVPGAKLAAEQLGGTEATAVLLLAGAGMQSIVWEPSLWSPIAEAGFQIIRFDWRDVGKSTWAPFRSSPYSIDTLVIDAFAVLDGMGVANSHVIGFSLGGGVAQLMAISHPDRVRSLSLLASGSAAFTPPVRRATSLANWGLTGPFQAGADVNAIVEQWRILTGENLPFNESAWARRALSWVERGQNPSCPHFALTRQAFGVDRRRRFEHIATPTLVLQGSHDPVIRMEHALAISNAIKGASLVVIEDRGHDVHLDPIVPAIIVRHLKRCEEAARVVFSQSEGPKT